MTKDSSSGKTRKTIKKSCGNNKRVIGKHSSTDLSIKIHISPNGICRFKKYKNSIPEQCCAKRLDIKEVVIPITIESISREAFDKCSKLRKIIFERGNKLKRIEERAFSETAIKILDLSNCSNIIILPDQLCMDCKDLEVVFLPEGISIIGMECFSGCINLKDVYYLGNTEPKLQSKVFDNCKSFNDLKSIEKGKIGLIIAQINAQVKEDDALSASDVWTVAARSSADEIVKADSAINIALRAGVNKDSKDKKMS